MKLKHFIRKLFGKMGYVHQDEVSARLHLQHVLAVHRDERYRTQLMAMQQELLKALSALANEIKTKP